MADQLQSVLGLSPKEAANLLEAAGGRVDAAMNLYFELQGQQGAPPAGPPGGRTLGGGQPAAPPAPAEPAPPPAPAAAPPAPREVGERVRLRVRGPGGQTNVDADSLMPIGELKQLLAEPCGVPAAQQQLRSGFPPQPVSGGDEVTLAAAGIRSGEQLTVQKSESEGRIVQGHTMGRYIPPSNPKGSFVRRVMPNDNSCMFHACAYVLLERSRTEGPQLRQRCAEVVAANPQRFTTEFLGRPNAQYCQWILHPDTWGGAIELSILSFLHTCEICALDIQTTRLYRYGEGEGYTTRAFLLYTGRHYDAMAMAPYGGCPEGPSDQVLFGSSDESVLQRARDYAKQEHERALAGK